MKGELTCQCCEFETKIYTQQLQGLYRLDTALFLKLITWQIL